MSSDSRPGAWERFQADLRRYDPEGRYRGAWGATKLILQNEALWAIATFRLGQYLREEAHPALRKVARIPYALLHRAVRLLVGIHLCPQTRIGPGLYIGHYGGIWISPLVTIGAHCNINHETTIGTADVREAPRLGDRVWVGPNSTITGNVQVGSGAVVGANSLVVSHVPENGVVIGVPAKVVSYAGSSKLLTPRFYQEPDGNQDNLPVAISPNAPRDVARLATGTNEVVGQGSSL